MGLAFCNRGDTQIANPVGIIEPVSAHRARHFNVSWRIVAEQRVTGQRPDIALFFTGWNMRWIGFARAITVREPLNQVGQLMADCLIGYFTDAQAYDHFHDLALAVNHRGAAQVFAGHADGDCLPVQLRKVGQRSIDHLRGPARQPFFHERS